MAITMSIVKMEPNAQFVTLSGLQMLNMHIYKHLHMHNPAGCNKNKNKRHRMAGLHLSFVSTLIHSLSIVQYVQTITCTQHLSNQQLYKVK